MLIPSMEVFAAMLLERVVCNSQMQLDERMEQVDPEITVLVTALESTLGVEARVTTLQPW